MALSDIDALMEQGRWAEAASALQHEVELQPTNAALLGRLGRCHFQLRNFEEAAGWLRRATLIDPDYYQGGFLLALALDRARQGEDALHVAEYWLERAPDFGPLVVLATDLRRRSP